MEVIVIIMLVLAIIGFGVACYALGHTNGYIRGYEQCSDYAIGELNKLRAIKR